MTSINPNLLTNTPAGTETTTQTVIQAAADQINDKTGEIAGGVLKNVPVLPDAPVLGEMVGEAVATVAADGATDAVNKVGQNVLNGGEEAGREAAKEAATEVASTVSDFFAGLYNSATETLESAYNATAETFGSAYNTTTETLGGYYNSTKTAFDEAVTDLKQPLVGLVADETTVLGGAYATSSKFISDNALSLGYVGAIAGGVTAINSTIDALQGSSKDSTAKQVVKVIAGVSLVAASVTYGASDDSERSALIITALTAATAKAVWEAVSAKTPPVFVLKLNPIDIQSRAQVVSVPKKLAA